MRRVRITGETTTLDPGARFGIQGRTLGQYVLDSKNGDLTLSDPFGATHTVSLTPFEAHCPELFLVIQFVVSREDDEFDVHDGGAVVLKEYDLPADIELPLNGRRTRREP